MSDPLPLADAAIAALDAGSIDDAAVVVLATPDPIEKARASRAAAQAWRDGTLGIAARPAKPPRRPGRLDEPALLEPAAMPRRKAGGLKGRIALLHALAHIELNAVNLAWDMVARFGPILAARDFYNDWVRVGDDEARHFLMLSDRLSDLGSRYGALPAHDGLWEAAEATAEDVLARLAVVPMVLEARGLDVCPDMIDKLEDAGDPDSASLLRIIYRDEIEHVKIGFSWFSQLCGTREQPMKDTWQALVRQHFRGSLKPPFNEVARDQAGFPRAFYQTWGGG
ncbi:MAG: ferritin-like domain-containing protein [Alphaproteobacteria bacterium]